MAKRAAPADDAQRIAVLVAGMHRSGTSLLTQVLVSLGCDAPKTLMAADEHNVSGYWESAPIAALNDALLESAGSSWDDWERFNPDWFASPAAGEFRERAQALLEDEYPASRLFVLKDPRICRLLPFWCEAIRQFGAEPRIAIPLRNPFDVADSLAGRDAIPPAVGFLLWLRHVLDAEAESRPVGRAFAWYDDLLANWDAVVSRLGRELDIAWPRRSTAAAVEIEERVSPALRHHANSAAMDDPTVSRWTKSTFEVLSRWGRGKTLANDAAQLDSIRSALDEAATVFGRPVMISARLGKRNRALQGEVDARGEVIAERERQIDSLNRAVRDRDEEIASLQSSLRNKDEQVAKLDRTVAERDARTDRLVHAVAERDGQVSAANETVRRRDHQIGETQKAIRDRDETTRRRDRQIEEMQKAIRDRDETTRRRDRQIEETQKAIRDRDETVRRRDRQIEETQKAIRDRDETVRRRDRQIGEMQKAIRDRDETARRRDRQIGEMQNAVRDRDERIAEIGGAMAERDALRDSLAERDKHIEELGRRVAKQGAAIDGLRQAVGERDAIADGLRQAVGERDAIADGLREEAAGLAATIADRDGELESVRRALTDREVAVAALQTSTSWRVTKPLRWVRTLFGAGDGDHQAKPRESRSRRRPIYYALRFCWRLVPLAPAGKRRLQERLVGALPARAHRLALSRAPSAKAYTHCGRLDLADRNYEASRENAAVPILFDPAYYLQHNEDIRLAGGDPLKHYLEHGALEGRLPIDVAAEELDPVIVDLHRFDIDAQDAPAFDADFYRALYPDLAELDDAALERHYEEHGRVESRTGSKSVFLRDICASPREIPIDFRPNEYLGLYPDLADGLAGLSPLEALRHYMRSGRWEPRLHTLRTDKSETPAAPATQRQTAPEQPPLCVLAHVYYPELWSELSAYLGNLPLDSYHLYVNLVDTTFTQELLTHVRHDFPHARVYISPNVGRDIGGHVQTLRSLRAENYPIFCLVHTKKSPHMSAGEAQRWRRKLLVPLLGSSQTAEDNIRLMLEDDAIGLLGAARCRYTEINDNPQKYHELLDRLGVKEDARKVDFLSGTMMFVRREVLQRLAEGANGLDFEPGDDQSLAHHRDGQWAHAVERAFGAVVRDMGYRMEWR